MTTAFRLFGFFKKPDGPIGMLVGGVLVAAYILFSYGPMWSEAKEQYNKISIHTKKISQLEKKQDRFEERFENLEKSQNILRDNQLLLICTSPSIGDSWKQKKNCSNRFGNN